MRFALAQSRRERVPAETNRLHEVGAGNVSVALIPPPPPSNPYLSLLYSALEPFGFRTVDDGAFRFRWLWANRRKVDVLHFNWPEGLYQYQRRPVRLRTQLSWVKLVAFTARLAAAQVLGFRLVWTIHQVYPHETQSRRLDRTAATILARACDLLLAHDQSTASTASNELGRGAERIEVLPHGSYVGVYPPGRDAAAVRAELGIPRDAFVFLSFGELRGYKDVDVLLEAFAEARARDVVLLVAGYPKDETIASRVISAAGQDHRIKTFLQYVRSNAVAELFAAVDAAVVARGDGGTSGSLVLALSMGVPVVVADRPAYRTLIRDGEAGWFFEPSDSVSLQAVLEWVAADAEGARKRGRAAQVIADQLRWSDIAAQAASAFAALVR